MPRTIRFHLDESCDPAIALGLRRHGIDAATTHNAGLLRASDEEHVAYALAQGRVILTQDEDFLGMSAAGVPHAGMIYCHQQSRSIGEIIASLLLIWEVYEPEEMINRV